MMWLKGTIWIALGIVVYAYAAYTILLMFLALIKKWLKPFKPATIHETWPEVTLLVAAYNEKQILDKKVRNIREIDYPAGCLHVVFVTDGSDDGSEQYLARYNDITVYHQPERKGKSAAMNRVMPYIHTPYVVFCDANTMLNREAVKELIKQFNADNVGCVAGEKKVAMEAVDRAASSGESIYWHYESFIKKMESEVYSAVGAAGELYALRTSLFRPVPEDTILDDFVVSLEVIRQGYIIRYTSHAFSVEEGSLSMGEEIKRKIRIATGSFQALFRYPRLLNIFSYGFFSFQYFSHKVLRWAIVPLAILILFIFNLAVVVQGGEKIYLVLFILQLFFYGLVFVGYLLRQKDIKMRYLFLPYYLISMNAAMVAGFIRYCRGHYTPAWEKSIRREGRG